MRPVWATIGGMQTFLPYADFRASARALDAKRLGKQRVETLQVLRGLIVPGYGWRHHPAVKMWAGYEEALGRYALDFVEVWTGTGRADTTAATFLADLAAATGITAVRTQPELAAAAELPPWLGDEKFHESHRSALVRKDAGYYGAMFGEVTADLDYVWPASDRSRRGGGVAGRAVAGPAEEPRSRRGGGVAGRAVAGPAEEPGPGRGGGVTGSGAPGR
jgi:pyrimidine dimer DNA glycosylase